MVSLLLATCGCASAPNAELTREFQRAGTTFAHAQSRKDFLKAASRYQSILERGVVSGELLYNRGNALLRAGERGRAIAAYRRARRYLPRDPYLAANLRRALGEDHREPPRPIIEYALFWQNWLSYPAKFYWTAALTALAVGLGLVGLLPSRSGSRRTSGRDGEEAGTLASSATISSTSRLARRAGLFAALLAGVMAVSAAYDWYRFDHQQHGVIVADATTARAGNSETYPPALAQPLAEGAEFLLLEQRGDWLRVKLASGGEAWIVAEAAEVY
jgi:tetratricopeptide (TPR) repeat protein